jgi:hypothetical protein
MDMIHDLGLHSLPLPRSKVFYILNPSHLLLSLMTKKRKTGQQLEKLQFDFKVTEIIDEPPDNNELENEIQCPSCQSVMILSVCDSHYYGCNQCNFCLYI